jgi:polysaccharide pyruvyl transferase WcaK-like protein
MAEDNLLFGGPTDLVENADCLVQLSDLKAFKRMRFLLAADIGGPKTYHVGDEAMLAANLDAIRRQVPGAQFTVISRDPLWSAAHYGCDAIRFVGFPSREEGTDEDRQRMLQSLVENAGASLQSGQPGTYPGAELIRTLGQIDAVVISGGGNLCATWPEQIYERVALLELAALAAKPAVVVGQTLGPELPAGAARQALESALRSARIIGVREYHSIGVALSLGVELRRIAYQLDDAILLAGEPVPPERFGFDFEARPWIGVTFAPAIFDAELSVEGLAADLDRIQQQTGASIVFMPHVRAPGDHPSMSDEAASRRIAGLMRTEAHVLEVCTAKETQWLTARAGLIISSRYHPIVFATGAGVPCIGVYTDYYTRVKIRGALAHTGRERYAIGAEELSAGMLPQLAIGLWSDRDSFRTTSRRKQIEYQSAEHDRWARVLETLRTGAIAREQGALSAEATSAVLRLEADDFEWLRARQEKRFETALGQLRTSLAAREEETKLQVEELESVKSVLSARDEQLTSLETVLQARDMELASIKPILAARDEELASVKSVLTARDKEITLQTQEIQSVKAVLAARDEELASIRPVLEARDRELASIKPVLAARDAELASIKAVLEAREKELAAIKAVLGADDDQLSSASPEP